MDDVEYQVHEEFTGADYVSVMVAGRSRCGKSTALNNIFGLSIPSCRTAAITTETVKINDLTIHVIDTPGLGALDQTNKMLEITSFTNGLPSILLYCLSVSPSNSLSEVDRNIIKHLQRDFGKTIWDKCIILLTFSDTARHFEFNSEDQTKEYQEYLKHHAQAFHALLQECGADVSKVKTIFECNNREEQQQQTTKEILAVPVGKHANRSEQPAKMPDIVSEDQDWTKIVLTDILTEIQKETKPRPREFFSYKSSATTLTVNAGDGATMATLGKGEEVGVLVGPPRIDPVIGAATRGTVASTTGFSIQSILHKWRKAMVQ